MSIVFQAEVKTGILTRRDEAVMKEGLAVWDYLMRYLICTNLLLSFIIVFFQRRDPKAVWTWLLILYFVPVFGFFFYLIFAQDYHKSRMFGIKEVEDRLKYGTDQREKAREASDEILPEYADDADLIRYNLEQAGAVLTLKNTLTVFTDGEEKFRDLRAELMRARCFIHIQYYIIKDDELFDSIAPILVDRAHQGVEVRILYDGMGGRFMPKARWEALRKEGILVSCFFPPVLGRLNLRLNYRNHRKIVVIDGGVGYVGGFNIGREYLGRSEKFGYWRDTHLKLTGEAAISLQLRFAMDWNYAAKENLFLDRRYFTDCRILEHGEAQSENVAVQIIASGPDSGYPQIRDNYLRIIHRARHHLYIQTPYFIPDDAVLSALRIAAASGVDVRLMIPGKPDHPFVYWATLAFAGELIRSGARCYVYQHGFLHAKAVMADGRLCSCGTANMDIRSFELNFEVNAVIYDKETTERMEEAFLADLVYCRELTLELYEERTLGVRFREQVSRLLAPLL